MDQNKINLALELYAINAIRFGDFTLKSGIKSPIYIDLRVAISYPKILSLIAESLWETIAHLKFELICGVPYNAIPLATIIAVQHNIPMIMRRKELKNYGTKKLIEGVFNTGQTCLLIEDIITSGTSIFETIAPIEKAGLKIQNIAVLIDREQNGKQILATKGYEVHSAFTLSQLLEILVSNNKIVFSIKAKVQEFLRNNQF